MENAMKDQIFISYRRNGGEALAQLLHDKLVDRGFNVFYDIECLKSGPFDTKLYEKIEECSDFILILPPQGLDRCIYDEDWVRCEIRHALKHSKNIVPVLMRGFVFPTMLPDDIQAISKMNGVEFETMEYLSARIDKIVSLLVSKPIKTATSYVPNNAGRVSLIRNVCSFGSCDFNNTSPSDAYYSEIIDRDRFNIVYFSISTAPIRDRSNITAQMIIYDTNNNIVYEETSDFSWSPSYNRLILSWVIRGTDGTFVKAGVYRVVFQIDDSATYEYRFKVFSKSAAVLDSNRPGYGNNPTGANGYQNTNVRPGVNVSTPNPYVKPAVKEKAPPINKYERYLSCPKGFLYHLLTSIAGLLLIAALVSEEPMAILFFLAITVTFGILLMSYTRKYIHRSRFITFLLVVFGFWYYGIFLTIMSICYIFNSKKWKAQLPK